MSHGSVRPDATGLLALRRAVALATASDPFGGPTLREAAAFRNVPTARGVVAAEAMTIPLEPAPPEPVPLAVVPVVAPRQAEPDAEQAVVMALVIRAQEGEADAFGELYDRYVDLVFRYIYYRVGSRALAEDLTSETFLRALRRISSFTWQGRDVGAWFVTIARNLIADHYKSGRYRLEVATADMLDADQAEEGPEGAVLDSLTNATLLEAVKELNPEQQECIVLRFLQGMSVAETALAMGKNEGAIKALQYRAVRALGRLLPADMVL
ncbi:MAG: polymerase sigma-70 factor, subfamily [Frankiaceae bacterium]|jgi:RNA polymerase sigma-70 factor (ECF subfamily)|nr:polymerase sigma-70 factor, subfamily [Frankiaceae bacterium]MDX6224358.1 polymerase sigma-70 factor, subfamily [Frankiales bacterium]MDX6275317.1 polymerase sigma-70 factor, subfamily [Frankiales bacterium]